MSAAGIWLCGVCAMWALTLFVAVIWGTEMDRRGLRIKALSHQLKRTDQRLTDCTDLLDAADARIARLEAALGDRAMTCDARVVWAEREDVA